MKLFYVGIYNKLQKEYVNCRITLFMYINGQKYYIYIQLIKYIFYSNIEGNVFVLQSNSKNSLT